MTTKTNTPPMYNANPRKTLSSGPDYGRQIIELENRFQSEIDLLKNRNVYIKENTTSLYYADADPFTTVVITTLHGTNDGANNIFTPETHPSFVTTGPENMWLYNLTNSNHPLYGILKYIGSSPINIELDVEYTVESPDKGGSEGYGIQIQVYVNDFLINLPDGGGNPAKNPSAIPLLISTTPLLNMHTGRSKNRFNIKINDIISVKAQINNAAAVDGFKIIGSRIIVNYTSTQYTNPIVES